MPQNRPTGGKQHQTLLKLTLASMLSHYSEYSDPPKTSSSARDKPKTTRSQPVTVYRGGGREERAVAQLTDCGDHCAYKVEGSGEVPSGPECVHSNACPVGLFILTQQHVEVFPAHPVVPREVGQLLVPEKVGEQLGGALQSGEDGRSTHQVEQDEPSQETETCIVLV